jgi:phosphoglycerol transferase MdoB-like AlkP superfamily enzyme
MHFLGFILFFDNLLFEFTVGVCLVGSFILFIFFVLYYYYFSLTSFPSPLVPLSLCLLVS